MKTVLREIREDVQRGMGKEKSLSPSFFMVHKDGYKILTFLIKRKKHEAFCLLFCQTVESLEFKFSFTKKRNVLLQSKSSQNSQGKVTGRLRALGRKVRLSRFCKRLLEAARRSSLGTGCCSPVFQGPCTLPCSSWCWQDTWPEAIWQSESVSWIFFCWLKCFSQYPSDSG